MFLALNPTRERVVFSRAAVSMAAASDSIVHGVAAADHLLPLVGEGPCRAQGPAKPHTPNVIE